MIKHFMYVPMTGLGLRNGYRGDGWLKNRIRIFYRFVLPSLMNQTRQSFTTWFSWREEERDNALVKEFERNLKRIRDFDFIFTYGGICFYDDKYPPLEAKGRLLKSLQANLPTLKEQVGDAKWVYMTIQPSDDMYLCDTVDLIQRVEPKEGEAFGFTQGYIMNYANLQIAEYNPITLPPFYTIVFPADTFLNPFDHMRYTGPYASHEYVKDRFKFYRLEGRGFVVGTHGSNISTTFNHPYKGRELTGDERDVILIKTGTLFSDPVIITNGLGLIARRVLNLLPFQSNLRKMYHSLPEKYKIF